MMLTGSILDNYLSRSDVTESHLRRLEDFLSNIVDYVSRRADDMDYAP